MKILQQFDAAKAQHPGMLLLFRSGDFYELLREDAETAAKILGLTLTTRDGIAIAGFPEHGLERYLGLLLRAGHRVAVCEPAELETAQDLRGDEPQGEMVLVTASYAARRAAGASAVRAVIAFGMGWSPIFLCRACGENQLGGEPWPTETRVFNRSEKPTKSVQPTLFEVRHDRPAERNSRSVSRATRNSCAQVYPADRDRTAVYRDDNPARRDL